MVSTAQNVTPPVLSGYTYIRPLGSGGFADVYLYDQSMPRRRVAVKVLRTTDLDSEALQSFRAEANVMARVSSHPAILTIYEASISADGRPYIAMEHCQSSYRARCKSGPIPILEVLSTGVRIGGALETLHQSGLLHRDIKPSNILLTEFGLPVLADFGIATSVESSGTDVVGMSVPWSAPEVLRESTIGTVQSEVFSFAATIFTMVEQHSPAQIPGGDNSREAMSARVIAGRLQPITRQDVPAQLTAVLNRALSRDPRGRQQTMAELVWEFQRIEQSLGRNGGDNTMMPSMGIERPYLSASSVPNDHPSSQGAGRPRSRTKSTAAATSKRSALPSSNVPSLVPRGDCVPRVLNLRTASCARAGSLNAALRRMCESMKPPWVGRG